MIDLHVHTHYSCDSETNLASYCKAAIKKKMRYICFTDHVDFNKADIGYMYYDSDAFFDELHRVRDEFGEKLNILSGIEFDCPHIYKKEFDKLSALPYDFILGSVHFWMYDLFPSDMVKQGIPAEKAFEKYWEEVYRMVGFGGIDSLAHMDFPKRYYKSCLWDERQISMIFKKMIKNGISLEINTSSLRKGLDEMMPGTAILGVYEKEGGKSVTFGADTHRPEELGAGYKTFEELTRGRFENTVYIKRKPTALQF